MRIQRKKAEGRRQNRRDVRVANDSTFCLLPSAFSLLEVMIASGLFFIATFTILQLISGTMRNARSLQGSDADGAALGMLASQLAMTNILAEAREHGNFDKLYPGYTYEYDIHPSSNGLVRVDFTVEHRAGRGRVRSGLTNYYFAPLTPVSPPDWELE